MFTRNPIKNDILTKKLHILTPKCWYFDKIVVVKVEIFNYNIIIIQYIHIEKSKLVHSASVL